MKLFLLAFVALAAAEPESFYPINGYSSGMVYPNFYNYNMGVRTYTAGNPVVKSGTFHTNLQNVLDGTKPAFGGQVYQPIHQRFAREAESESFYPYNYNYNPLGYSNMYNNMYYSAGAVPSVNYLNARSYYPYVKREAESESDSFYPGYYNYNYNTYNGVRSVIPTNTYSGVRSVIPTNTYSVPTVNTVASRYTVPVASSVIPTYQRYYNNYAF